MSATSTLVSVEEYERRSLAEPDRHWELHDGRLVEKPAMSMGHDLAQLELVRQLAHQLDTREYKVQFTARLRTNDGRDRYLIPDVCVTPVALIAAPPDRRRLNAYTEPLPLVIEVWSSSTGDYDNDDKLPAYQLRGDLEIWRLHPFERTLTVWRRQLTGEYRELTIRERTVSPVAFPWVTIHLDAVYS